MKANELMIGDWILMDGHKLRVTKLTADRDYDNCEPIPLSAEILEKNPKVYYLCSHYLSTEECAVNGFVLKVGTNCIMGINYTHQLQHALRLCGLTDMADNFQLPELPKEDTK